MRFSRTKKGPIQKPGSPSAFINTEFCFQHTDPDYSCAYVIITTKNGAKGYGLTFTLGRGTEIVIQAVRTLSNLILHKNAREIFDDFSQTWRNLTSETQIRW